MTYLRLVDENNIELRTLLMNWNQKVMELGKGYYKDPWDLIKVILKLKVVQLFK